MYSLSLVAKEQILLHEYCQKQNPWPLEAARKGMTVSMQSSVSVCEGMAVDL